MGAVLWEPHACSLLWARLPWPDYNSHEVLWQFRRTLRHHKHVTSMMFCNMSSEWCGRTHFIVRLPWNKMFEFSSINWNILIRVVLMWNLIFCLDFPRLLVFSQRISIFWVFNKFHVPVSSTNHYFFPWMASIVSFWDLILHFLEDIPGKLLISVSAGLVNMMIKMQEAEIVLSTLGLSWASAELMIVLS